MSRFDPALIERARAAVRAAQERERQPPPVRLDADAAPSQAESATADDLPADGLRLAAALCRRWEGLHLRPYLCPAGVPTIGYGSTVYPDGRRVRLTDKPISEETAEAMLMHDLRTVRLPAVRRLCHGVDTPQRMAAILDFAFNLGEGALASSTLRRKVNAGRWDEVPGELRRWVFAGGRKLLGLVRRREDEARLV